MSELDDRSEVDQSTDETVASTKDVDSTETSIVNEMINILSLDDNEQKDNIMKDLLENGRQALVKYRDDIITKAYKEAMNNDESALVILLKKYFDNLVKSKYGKNYPWFLTFLEEYEKGDDHDIYEHFLIRMANHGLQFMNSYPLLSIALQLLFEGIDDVCLKETNVFERLWLAVTNDGIKSITKYSDFIIKSVMNKQLKKQLILFQTLREYYRDFVYSILKECNIGDKGNLYALALDDIVENGWMADMKSIEDNLTPKSYRMLLTKLQSYYPKQKPLENGKVKRAQVVQANGESKQRANISKTELTSIKNEDSFVWTTIVCDGCKMSPLVGQRYYCPTCVGYDLCARCKEKGHEHELLLVTKPSDDKNQHDILKNTSEQHQSNGQEDSIEKDKTNLTLRGRSGFTAVQNTCQQETLKVHNTYRARHGVPPLILDDTICRKAQQYADYLAKTGQFRHSSNRDGLGENLYYQLSAAVKEPSGFGTRATETWYNEVKDYNYNRPGFSASTAHFTQIVWKSTKKLGVGISFAEGGRKVIVVARYDPAAHMTDELPKYVPVPSNS